jgi:hypothetical protein
MIFSVTGTFFCFETRFSQTLAACSRAARSSAMRHRASSAIRRRHGGRSARPSKFWRIDSRSRSRVAPGCYDDSGTTGLSIPICWRVATRRNAQPSGSNSGMASNRAFSSFENSSSASAKGKHSNNWIALTIRCWLASKPFLALTARTYATLNMRSRPPLRICHLCPASPHIIEMSNKISCN